MDANIYWDVGLKNLSYIVYTSSNEILLWDVVDTNVRRQNGLSQIVRRLKDFLDILVHSEKFQNVRGRVNRCIIENQPTMNPMMRIVSGILGTYFLVKCGWNPLYYNPAFKLMNVDLQQTFDAAGSGETTNAQQCKSRRRRKNTKEFATAYRLRKRASIEETRRILQLTPEYSQWLIHFETHKHKQDDLADTFLMARCYERSPPPESLLDDDIDSEDDSDSEEEQDIHCDFLTLFTNKPRPCKKKQYEDSVEHYKFCLEERLHKEYGKNANLCDSIDSIVKISKSKGIVAFKNYLTTLTCQCSTKHTNHDVYLHLLFEPHWKTLFS
jgi:hypothetical protein